ncbi:MAG: hypothetical protein WC609_03425 [Candidatus Paceibacterota bacterium]|jgi:hypothetical protein
MEIKFFKKEKSFKKEGFHPSPSVLWKFVLLATAGLIIVSFIFAYNLFLQVNKEFVPTDENTKGQIRIVKKEEIQKTLEYFSEREKRSAEIMNSLFPVVDPSL